MAVRSFLFVSRVTVPWCVARYVLSDNKEEADGRSGNFGVPEISAAASAASQCSPKPPTSLARKGAWWDLFPFSANTLDGLPEPQGGGPTAYQRTLAKVRELTAPISQCLVRADPFAPENWTAIDVSNWWQIGVSTDLTDAQKDDMRYQTISEQSKTFMLSLRPETTTIQWAHIFDPELAVAWLERARKLTPAQIDALPPQQQFEAVRDMWAAFGQYWKALNVCPQGWAKYREAWEYCIRPANQIILRDRDGVCYPRPFSAPMWRKHTPTWYPAEAPHYIGPWRWEAILANETWGVARTGHTKLDAAMTVRFGSIQWRATVWSINGSGPYGEPTMWTPTDLGPENYTQCQDMMQYGGIQLNANVPGSPGKCFVASGVNETHFVWLDNAGLMSGGVTAYWNPQPTELNMPRDRGPALTESLPNLAFTSNNPRRRNRVAWGIVRCPASAPPVDDKRAAADYYNRFNVTGAEGDWARTTESAEDRIEVKAEYAPEHPRYAGPITWRDGILFSGNPLGYGTSYLGWPVTGANWGGLASAMSGTRYLNPEGAPTWVQGAPHNIFGYSGISQMPGADFNPIWPVVLWQPPAKRYVDLLWPLLEYLHTLEGGPMQVAYEVKLDVLGKNGFSLAALGNQLSSETRTNALDQAAGQFNQQMNAARQAVEREQEQAAQQSRRVVGIVMGVTQAIVSTAASAIFTPAAGAVVGSAFSLINGAIGLAQAVSDTQRSAWTRCTFDVFGRPDAVEGQGQQQGAVIGNYERYAMHFFDNVTAGDVVGNVTPKIHEHMRRLGRSPGQPSGWSSFWPGFVVPPSTDPSQVVDPYPVGFEPPPPSPESVARRQAAQRAATFFADPFASEASRSLENVYALWGSESWAQIRWRPPLPPRRLRNLEPKPQEGVNKAAVAAGAIAGVALGEVLARTGK